MKPYTIVLDGVAHTRPQTRADCRGDARPCPWVSCRHHLLLEVAKAKAKEGRAARATSIRLNRPHLGKAKLGRRPGMDASEAHALVQRWIADAVDLLASMPATCALDVVEAFPDGLVPRPLGKLLGVGEQAIDQELRKADVREAMGGLREHL